MTDEQAAMTPHQIEVLIHAAETHANTLSREAIRSKRIGEHETGEDQGYRAMEILYAIEKLREA